MVHRVVRRLLPVAVVLALAAACTGTPSSPRSGSAPTGTNSPLPSAVASARPGYESAGTPAASRDLAALAPAGTADVRFRRGSADTRRRFDALVSSLEGVPVTVTYYRVLDRSTVVADLAVCTFTRDQVRSPVFRDQIVTQLVGSLATGTKFRTEIVSGRKFVTAGTSPTVVGGLSGVTAVVGLARSGHHRAASVRAAVGGYLDR